MFSDTIYQYIGREAEWVALCGFYAVESSSEIFEKGDAADLIESVWEFCVESCKEADVAIPIKSEAIEIITEMIEAWNSNSLHDQNT